MSPGETTGPVVAAIVPPVPVEVDADPPVDAAPGPDPPAPLVAPTSDDPPPVIQKATAIANERALGSRIGRSTVRPPGIGRQPEPSWCPSGRPTQARLLRSPSGPRPRAPTRECRCRKRSMRGQIRATSECVVRKNASSRRRRPVVARVVRLREKEHQKQNEAASKKGRSLQTTN